jgi:alpha-beta hydrolase superfamily lysophospholipase
MSNARLSPPARADWFQYFPEDYRWSAAMAVVLGSMSAGGADFGEVDRVGRRLRTHVGDDEAWFELWREEGDRVRELAEAAEREGRRLTAAAAYLRSSAYHQIGERFRTPKDELANDCYSVSIDSFGRYASLIDRPRIEKVEVPLDASAMPALMVHADGAALRPPVVVYFDGLDITKEMCYVRGAEELARRGVSTLVVDGPGNGESVRFRNMPLRYDYEAAGSAALDYLATRDDVDAARVGVMGISLGGYYAPRCAAMDQRFRACVAWGAIWDYHATWKARLESNFTSAMSVPGHHISWVLGVDSVEAALAKLEDFRLDGVVHEMTCPFLVLHGEHDEQVPLSVAEQLLHAAGSHDKTLRVYTPAEGGAQHCQMDSPIGAITDFADWLSEKLVP